MNILTILTAFTLCWMLIEITVFLSSKLTTTNNTQLSYESFIWSLRIIAVLLLGGLIIFMDLSNDFDLKSHIFVCRI
jgi:hypothetical protein